MSAPTIRDEVLAAWRKILVRVGARESTVDALVLELEQAAANRGARLPRHPRVDDPNALALGPKPPPADPDTAQRAAAAARAALRPYGGVDARAQRPATDHLPPIPNKPQEPQ